MVTACVVHYGSHGMALFVLQPRLLQAVEAWVLVILSQLQDTLPILQCAFDHHYQTNGHFRGLVD
jgi:hypothetical protein